jgi:DnaK suppressor protein
LAITLKKTIMSENNKKLTDQLVQAVLPKLKGLSEKNAKKVLHETNKSIAAIAKKYSKLIAEQEKEKAKAKEKAAKETKKKAEKEAKKKAKEGKKVAKAKLLASLIAKEKSAAPAVTKKAPAASKKAPVAKAPAKPRSRAPKAKK